MQTFQDWGWCVVLAVCVLWGWQKFYPSQVTAGVQEKPTITGGTLIAAVCIAFLFGIMVAASSAAGVPSVVEGGVRR